ncbi:hypothetical protein ACS0TY_024144 [Phlomoides rotata]
MENMSYSQTSNAAEKSGTSKRCIWSTHEKTTLILCMKEIIERGWKVDNVHAPPSAHAPPVPATEAPPPLAPATDALPPPEPATNVPNAACARNRPVIGMFKHFSTCVT